MPLSIGAGTGTTLWQYEDGDGPLAALSELRNDTADALYGFGYRIRAMFIWVDFFGIIAIV